MKTKFKKVFYRYAPFLVALSGAGITFLGHMTGRALGRIHDSDAVIWVGVGIVQAFAGYFYGREIKKLELYANTDSLTDLWNRRHFRAKLQEEIARIQRSGQPLSVALVDIDNFKAVNDTYGHIAGDKLLQSVARLLKRSTREIDTVARWGGDEFVIILPDTDVSKATQVAERIRQNIQVDPQYRQVTVSMGIIPVVKDMDIEQVFGQVDWVLYKAKDSKNTIVAS